MASAFQSGAFQVGAFQIDGAPPAAVLAGRPRWRNRTRGKSIEETIKEFLQEQVDDKQEARDAASAYLQSILDESVAQVQEELTVVNRALHRIASANDSLMVAAMDLEISRLRKKVAAAEEKADEDDLEAILMIL